MVDAIDMDVGTVSTSDFAPSRITHRVFFEPKFLFAFFNKSDELHEESRAVAEFVRSGKLPHRQFIVNEHALDEAATRLKKRASLRYADLLLQPIEKSALFQSERVPNDAFEEACTRFVEWDDTDALFTDFVSASHMEESGIDHIATYNRHYRQFDVVTIPHIEFE